MLTCHESTGVNSNISDACAFLTVACQNIFHEKELFDQLYMKPNFTFPFTVYKKSDSKVHNKCITLQLLLKTVEPETIQPTITVGHILFTNVISEKKKIIIASFFNLTDNF